VLVFKEEGSPDEFGAADDLAHIQDAGGGRMEYSREIRAVGRDFIVRHYRAYGGAVPPAIEHQAVDDAFLGKASVTYYCSKGNWMRLQGAD
jgi:hypothetical protein